LYLRVFTIRVIKQVVVIIEAYHFCQLRTKFYPASCSQGYLNIGGHQCGFRNNSSNTYHIFDIRQILEKKWEYSEAFISYLQTSRKRDISYIILIEFGIPIELVKLIQFWLNLTYNRTG
jgi:hypothetical protein